MVMVPVQSVSSAAWFSYCFGNAYLSRTSTIVLSLVSVLAHIQHNHEGFTWLCTNNNVQFAYRSRALPTLYRRIFAVRCKFDSHLS